MLLFLSSSSSSPLSSSSSSSKLPGCSPTPLLLNENYYEIAGNVHGKSQRAMLGGWCLLHLITLGEHFCTALRGLDGRTYRLLIPTIYIFMHLIEYRGIYELCGHTTWYKSRVCLLQNDKKKKQTDNNYQTFFSVDKFYCIVLLISCCDQFSGWLWSAICPTKWEFARICDYIPKCAWVFLSRGLHTWWIRCKEVSSQRDMEWKAINLPRYNA